MTEAYDKVQLLRGKLSDWFTINPILDEGEAAVVFDTETDVPIGIKVGNGKLHFRDLPFMGAGSFTTYTKEEIDDLFEESNKKIGILQVKVDALYQIIPSSATPDNKLITLKELTESGSSLQKIIGELTQNKLDKNVEVTTLDQAYIKKADGTQALMDISNETAESSSGIAARRAGRIKTRRAFENDDAVNKEDLQAIKSDLDTKKLDKIAVTDNNEYAYLQDKTSSKLGRVSDDIISGVIVKRTPAGTIKSTKATQAGETVILEQLQDVSADLDAHKKDVSNPHKVTRAQVGLGNVDNTSDLSKPISTATQNALNAKQKTIPGISSSAGFVLQPPISDGGNPVRKDIKYFASATDLAREALLREQADDNKVDKKKGYDLSQNDFTDAIKETYDETVKKVSGIAPNAQVNVLEKIVLFGNEVPVINKRVILSGIAQSKDLQAEETSRIQADEKLDGAIKANTKNITDESTIREEADNAISDRIDKIDDVIPEQASKINQLADKDFVNSSIATNTATFWGTFVSADDLKAEATKPGKNDYANVRTTDDEGNYIFTRFKYAGKTVDDHTQYDPTKWEYEYTVNSSGFTAEQWAAINSGITATLRGQITLNTSAIEKNVNAIGQLKTNKVDSETYNNGLENLKTDLEAEIATKEREASLQISDWFNLAENVWAKNAGVNVPLQEIVNKSYDDEFYKNYIDNLRRLNKGSQVPFDINSWANILAHEDSSEDIWIFSQKKGLFYIISVDDTSKEIKFTERPLYSLATLDDLSETKDQIDNELKLYFQKSIFFLYITSRYPRLRPRKVEYQYYHFKTFSYTIFSVLASNAT